jgi:L-arabinose isomerase
MKKEFWLVIRIQFLYGPEVLDTVEARGKEMAGELSRHLPYALVYKGKAKTSKELSDFVREANYRPDCLGIVTWCHTFSPSKMWLNALENLQKPWCHLATRTTGTFPTKKSTWIS